MAEGAEGILSQSRVTHDTIQNYDPWLEMWGSPFTHEGDVIRPWNPPSPKLELVDHRAKTPELRDVGGLTVDDGIASPNHSFL